MLKTPNSPSLEKPLLEAAGRCVACGLCLPHCPTYRKTLNEADSPRGRIMLMSAVLDGALPTNRRFFEHLDRCLSCRACEDMCPNNVSYGQLVNRVRSTVQPFRRRSALKGLFRRMVLDGIVARPAGLAQAAWALRGWERLGGRTLARWASRFGWAKIGRLAEALPPMPAWQVWQSTYPAEGAVRGRVALFLGCVARVLDVETLNATVFVLNKLGYTVDVPSGQTCCGALHAGQGEAAKADALARENCTAFTGENWDAVIVTASGCCTALREYPLTLGREGAAPARNVTEIGAFLSNEEIWREVEILPLHEKIALHEPCSLRHVLHGQAALYRLLRRIPGAQITALAGNDQCCGAGGAYRLTQPEMSAQLLADKVAAIKAGDARIVASSNFGCALHLAAGAGSAGLDVEVVHPVVLLARQMGYKV
ncbi:MAG: (Fe-S)-binding protein [Sulfuricellaceae bacterium]